MYIGHLATPGIPFILSSLDPLLGRFFKVVYYIVNIFTLDPLLAYARSGPTGRHSFGCPYSRKGSPKGTNFPITLSTIGHFRVSSDSSPSVRSCSGNSFPQDFYSAMGSPAAMSEDLGLTDSDCILYLEQTIDDLKSQGDVTKQLLQDILGRLGPTAPIGPAPMQRPASSNQQIETPIVTTTTPSAGQKKKTTLNPQLLLTSTGTKSREKPS